MAFWNLAFLGKMQWQNVKAYARDPLKFSAIVAHRWWHLQYCPKICRCHSCNIALDSTKTVSVKLRCLLNKTFAVE